MKEKSEIRKRLERLELSNRPKIIIRENLKNQIDYLHSKVGGSEWSGELITSEEGTINDMDEWKIKCEDIFLADIGTAGSTEYTVDKGGFKAADVVAMYDKFPDLLEGKQKNQHIHTHHNMSAFFSGTDWENLEDRADMSNYFMMLVVNFNGKYCAKVAFKAKIKNAGAPVLEFSNNSDSIPVINLTEDKEREVLVVMDCDIIHEVPVVTVTKEFEDRYKEVKEKIEEEKKAVKVWPKYSPPATQSKFWKDDWNDHSKKKDKKKDKKISEMTEKEWKAYDSIRPVGKVETKNVFAFLNANILNSHDLMFSSPIPNIIDVNNKFRDMRDRAEWMLTFQFTMRDKFDAIFYPNHTDSFFEDIISAAINFLKPYTYNELAKDMTDIMMDEIMSINSKKGAPSNEYSDWGYGGMY